MQDSLEDYVRISKNKKINETTKVSPETLITVQRKKECEARAMKIVEFLIEGKLRKEAFFECLKHINPSYYQDIVEERAISKLCGYCLCNRTIPEMPKKQYHISTKLNKVYDITDRKNYCSNICYKSSLHVKAQIETSPLWLRKPENTPEFSLLPSSEKGIPGEEIDQGVLKPLKGETTFTSISFFTEASLDEVIHDEIKKRKKKSMVKPSKKDTSMLTIDEGDENKDYTEKTSVENDIVPLSSKEDESLSPRSKDALKKETTEVKTKSAKKAVPVDILLQIRRHVNEWLTLETLIFLHGDAKVKTILNRTTLSDYFDKLKIAELQTSQQIRYFNICRKLKLKEIAEDKFDRSVTVSKLKPIPDYKQLKEESKNLVLKVRAFYSGALSEQEDTNFPTNKRKEDDEDNIELVLPLVDATSQNLMRKRIYLNSVNGTMQKLLPILNLNDRDILEGVQALVKTFTLLAHNTVFKPIVWNVIGIALLKMLSIRDSDLQRRLEEEQCVNYIKLLLKPFPNNESFINDVVTTANDIEKFVENYITANDQ